MDERFFNDYWEKISKEKSVWDRLEIENMTFIYRGDDGERIELSSFDRHSLPDTPANISLIGKLFAKMSAFANIMASRPGTEEVTFYSLKHIPHGRGVAKFLDRKFLSIGAPPFNWRREMVVEFINTSIRKHVVSGEKFGFMDIGSGGGFDGLEIIRLLRGVENIVEYDELSTAFKIINIDIDKFWMDKNIELTKLSELTQNTLRRNISVFDYFESRSYESDLGGFENLVISCNGFAEFFEDRLLSKLFSGISEMTDHFTGTVDVVIPFAVKNVIQEKLSNLVGFNYIARTISEIQKMVSDAFPGFEIRTAEKQSQIVFFLTRGAN